MIKNILIAEDNNNLCRALKGLFEDVGYEVRTAEDGSKALKLVREQSPDLLITDNEMPVMNGYDLLNQLGRDGYTFPALFWSSGSSLDSSQVEYRGKVEYHNKNHLESEDLLNLVREILTEKFQ